MAAIRIEGIDDVLAAINRGEKAVVKAAKIAVTEVATDVARRADELVPFDEGTLRNSQIVDLPTTARSRIEATIAYGGPAAPYAVVQHEDVTLWHPPKPPGKSKVGKRQGTGPVEPGGGRGPKYLEHPLLEKEKTFGDEIVKAVKRELKKA